MEVLLQGPALLSLVRNLGSSSQSSFCTLCIHSARRDADVKEHQAQPEEMGRSGLECEVKISS